MGRLGIGDTDRARALLGRIDFVRSDGDQQALVGRVISAGKPLVVSFINAHALNLACNDQVFYEDLIASDVLLRDGSGMRILCALMGVDPGRNMNGTDFIPQLLHALRGRGVALFGTSQAVLERASEQIEDVVAARDGFHPVDAYVQAATNTRADVFVLAMGMPKQERVAIQIKRVIARPIVVVNGGAILDFLAGEVPRAPRWLRAIGMEWTYRLLREPGRMWRRYLLGNAVFLLRAVALRLGR